MRVKIPLGALQTAPRMSDVEWAAVLEMSRERAGVRADPHRDPLRLRRADHLGNAIRAADVSRVDANGRDAGFDRLQCERVVEVEGLAQMVREISGRPDLPLLRAAFDASTQPDRYVGNSLTMGEALGSRRLSLKTLPVLNKATNNF